MDWKTDQQIVNLKVQNEQQIYSRIIDARLKLEKTEEFTRMANESPVFKERFDLVYNPSGYYTIVSSISNQ